MQASKAIIGIIHINLGLTAELVAAITAVLRPEESRSGFIRDAIRREIDHRRKGAGSAVARL